MTRSVRDPDIDKKEDSLVGVPDHPVAAVAGALATGAATGAVVGTAAGPVGTVVGAVAGAVAGALGGDAIASSIEQARDADDGRTRYSNRPYVKEGDRFEDFEAAYEFGTRMRRQYAGRSFESVEPELAVRWEGAGGNSRIDWDRARPAVRDAWGDSDVAAPDSPAVSTSPDVPPSHASRHSR